MTTVILQPGYLPWLGYFDLMSRADTFVILDDVQYTVRDWRSRNRIKTPDGVMWLTIPVQAKGVREKLIKDVAVDNSQLWQRKHLKNLESFYKKAPYFDEIRTLINGIYEKTFTFLIDVDMTFILKVREYLSLEADIVFSSEIPSHGEKDERLLSICKAINTTLYLTGDAAKDYLRQQIFSAQEITVEWQNYQHPYYNQLWLERAGFISHLSIIDLLFNHGPASLSILTGRKVVQRPRGINIKHADDAQKLKGSINE
jgi:hypothetical protein